MTPQTVAAATIGTRGSALALVQTEMVRRALLSLSAGLAVDTLRITTRGDIVHDRPLAAIGGNALFVAEIENALRDGRIDLAVHSAKDLPSSLAADVCIGAFLKRADPFDALVSPFGGLANLPVGARVGTSSPRRSCQLRSIRPDLTLLDIRGNVETRLAKLQAGTYDAIVLAAAGLERLGLAHAITETFDTDTMLPAVGQGAIAIEIRADDPAIAALVAPLDHLPTSVGVRSERAFLAAVGGGCSAPIAAHASIEGDELTLAGLIGNAAGRVVRNTVSGNTSDPEGLGRALAARLLSDGGAELMEEDRGTGNRSVADD